MKKGRRRYVLFQLLIQGAPIDDKQLIRAIRENLLSLYGELCVADSRIYLNEFDMTTGIGIIQCNAASLSQVITSAALIGNIDDTYVSFAPIKTSGTLKGLGR
jgi:RNase P/RNase MRP subunit POP5